jgi:hypothetical protein
VYRDGVLAQMVMERGDGLATAAEPARESTIGPGEDTPCAGCGYFLAAGAPAWPDEEGKPLCCDCATSDAAECGWCHAKAADGADLLPLLDESYCRDANACAGRRADGRADQ